MLGLYNAAMLPLRLLVGPLALWQGRDPRRRREWRERRGIGTPGLRPGGVWLHGSSMGEARVVSSVARRLRERKADLPIGVSAFTPTGRASLPAPPQVDAAFFLPLDFPQFVRRALEAVNPALRPQLARLARVGVQSDEDAQRFESLGVPRARVEVTGNIKYDLPLPPGSGEQLRGRLRLAADRPVVVAGSTGHGEEASVLHAFLEARRDREDLFLILAPRHVQRTAEVVTLLESAGLRHRRLTEVEAGGVEESDVLLVDTVGDLASLYRVAWVAFVGGTLVPVGGHNLLEPAAVSVPVLFGPHTEHVSSPAAKLENAGGGRRVRDRDALAGALRELFANDALRRRMGSKAEQVLSSNRGALDRSVEIVRSTLERPGSSS
jgi:3-deoxy-D-manno-octulosonic-acid transferase